MHENSGEQCRSVAGVVVLYHSDRAVRERLESYREFLDFLYIFDNSEPALPWLQKILSSMENVEIFAEGQNFGLGRAYNWAAGKAKERGIHWLLIMDDDSAFFPGHCSRFLDCVKREFDSAWAVLGPEIVEGEFCCSLEGKISVSPVLKRFILSSGSLVRLSWWDSVGGFRDDFFIDEIDHDFCLKVGTRGGKVVQLKGILMHHRLGVRRRRGLGPWGWAATTRPSIRTYFMCRNHILMIRSHFFHYPGLLLSRTAWLFLHIMRLVLLEPERRSYLRQAMRGFLHGVQQRGGSDGSRRTHGA